jgi:multidrug efflux pump subunit AcrA (membrane-fusion protein)
MPGRVARVDRVAKPIPGTTRVKQVEVLVDLDSTRADLAPGLTANVRIIIEEFPDALVVPLECLFQRDSLNVVYVRERAGFVPHRVTVTRQGPDFAVLDCDLKGGERLPLREPDPALIRTNKGRS